MNTHGRQPSASTLPEAPVTGFSGKVIGTSEDQFQLLVESVQDYAIFLLDPAGRIASWNRGAERIKGYTAGEILGRHFSVFYPTEDIRARKPEGELKVAAAEGRFEDEGWRVKKDGSRFWANVVITALRSLDGELRGFAKVTRDAGEHLRAEQALREGNDRFWTLFHSVRVGVVLTGPRAEILMFNAAACELMGVTENQLPGQTSFDSQWKAVYEDGSECSRPEHPVLRAIATGEPVWNSVLGVQRPGLQDCVWLLVNAEPRLDADGSVKEVICTFTDITDRKRAEAVVAEWKNRYEAAIRASGQILYDWDTTTNDVAYRGDFERILGYSAEELEGGLTRWMELVDREDREAFQNMNLRVLATREPFRLEYHVKRKDGSFLLVRDEGHFYFDEAGKIVRMVGFVTDITEQKRAEQQVRASEERFRDAFAHAAIGIASVDLEGRFVRVNQAYCELTGYTEQELTSLDFSSITYPEDRPGNMRLIRQLVKGEIPSFVIEKRYVRKDGRIVWVRNSVSLLRDSRHNPDRMIALVEDITERKQAEDELRELSGRLLRLQDDERKRLARELHDSTAQSMAALCMNLGVVSEEASALEPRARHALDESLALADQCVRELRTFSYLLHPPVLDDLGLASALSWYVDGFAQRSGIPVTVDLPRDLGRLPHQVELVLFRAVQESLTNIHRHSGSRKASIRITISSTEILLEVADEGHGITGGPLPHSLHEGPGLGVGIASMRERVREIGGRFEVESKSGGTRVQVVIPRSSGRT